MRKQLIQWLSGLLYLHRDGDFLMLWQCAVIHHNLLDHFHLFLSISALQELKTDKTPDRYLVCFSPFSLVQSGSVWLFSSLGLGCGSPPSGSTWTDVGQLWRNPVLWHQEGSWWTGSDVRVDESRQEKKQKPSLPHLSSLRVKLIKVFDRQSIINHHSIINQS